MGLNKQIKVSLIGRNKTKRNEDLNTKQIFATTNITTI